jgi:hypothetical protein
MANPLTEQQEHARWLAAKDELDALVATAQGEAPPQLGALAARRMVRGALATADLHALRRRRYTRYASLCAAAALLLCFAGYANSRLHGDTQVAVAADGLPLRLSLKTGDTVVLAPASTLAVLSEKPALRRVQLVQGSALFDVSKRDKAQRFEVKTPHALVRVRGTVFTVLVATERSVVRVHEGSVWIGARVLTAGESWASDNKPLSQLSRPEQSLAADVRAAVAARIPVVHAQSEQPATEALGPPSAPLISATPVPASPPTKPPARAQTSELDQLRALLRHGQTEQAIALARTLADRDDAFVLLLADALRAQGHFDEAQANYEAVAGRALGAMRAQAGFAAAQIALVTQGDALRALHDIERFELGDSALSERASVLHVEALLRLGRGVEARQIAVRYLAQQPETETSARMRRVLVETRGSAREQNQDASVSAF